MPGSEVDFRIVVGDYTTTVGNGLHSEQFIALLSAMWYCLRKRVRRWRRRDVVLHDPYGVLERRLFAQVVYRPSLRRAC